MSLTIQDNINKETNNLKKLRDSLNSMSADTKGKTVIFEFHIMTEGYGLDAYVKMWEKTKDQNWKIKHQYCVEAKSRNYTSYKFEYSFKTTMLEKYKKEKMMSEKFTPLYATFTSDNCVYIHNLDKINFNEITESTMMLPQHSSTDLYGYNKKIPKQIYDLPIKDGIKIKL